MASENMKHRRLQELSESDFEIVEGQPDIRGWEVRNGRDQKIGEVDELILDARDRKVRYLIVDLNDNELDLEDREVLIPIGLAELHEDDDDVVIPGISTEQLQALPEYEEDLLDEEVERTISGILGRQNLDTPVVNPLNSDFYEHDHFNESNLYRRRMLPEHTSTTDEPKSGKLSLQDRMEQSRNEVEGYMGSDTRERNRYSGSFDNEYLKEELEENEAVPVNRNPGDLNDPFSSAGLENTDELTGDNIRNVKNDIDNQSNQDSGFRNEDRSDGRNIAY